MSNEKIEDWKYPSREEWHVKTGQIINEENRTVYLTGVWILGIITGSTIGAITWLSYLHIEIPQALIAIGSVAVGALGSLFTNSK